MVTTCRPGASIEALVGDLAAHDRDANPKADGTGRMGIYYHGAMFTREESASPGRGPHAPGKRKR